MDKKITDDLRALRLHFFYVTVILVAVIILLASGNWTGITGFTDYLTSAGTMVSIVLGVLAIIYSFVSGDSISKSLGSVASAAQELQAARSDFASIVNAASELTESSKASSSQLSNLVAAVSSEVQELKLASTELNLSTAGIAKSLGQLPERFDKIDSRLEESLKSRKPDHTNASAGNTSTLQMMISFSSTYGRAVIYAASLSKEKNKPIVLQSEPFKNAAEYCYGYLGAADAADVLNYRLLDIGTLSFQIDEFPLTPQEVIESLRPHFDTPERGQSLKLMLDDVEKYFAEGEDSSTKALN